MKNLLTISLVIFLSNTVLAQSDNLDPAAPRTIVVKDSIPKAKIGVKAGMASNQLTGNIAYKQAATTGILGGGFIELRKKKYGVQLEAMVRTEKHTLMDSFINGGSLSFIYLDVPVLFEYRLFPGLWVQAGLQFGTILSVTQSPGTTLDPKTIFQSNDFSGVAGLEAKVLKRFSVGGRYIAGLSNLNNGQYDPGQAWKTTNVQFYIGYQIL